jgi:hypothetical protein
VHLHSAAAYKPPIKVSLHEVSLLACPEFGALSYTWATEDGDASQSRYVECEGGFINITANYEAALYRLRQQEGIRVLWVDAICIDQSNQDERALQIPLMRQIYSEAAWVGLWLGEASSIVDEDTKLPLSDIGMNYMHDFAVEIADRMNAEQDIREGPLYQEFIKAHRAFQHYGNQVFNPRIQGFWDILHRRWWQRLWVTQELALAKSAILMCGSQTEAFENLVVLIKGLIKDGSPVEEFEFKANFITSAFHQLNMRRIVQGRIPEAGGSEPEMPGTRALEILNATRNTRATDPRDKIYGILGFFGDPESDVENIFPPLNYKKTAAELYADVARAIITNTRSLDVMSSCHGYVQSTVPDLPSWAAAWNDTPLQFFDQDQFNAASDSSVVYEESGDTRFLRIRGRRIDTVNTMCPQPDTLEYTNEMCTQLWRQWSDLAFSLLPHSTRESMKDVLMKTLCWGSNLKLNRLEPGEYHEHFDAWFKILRSTDDLETAAKHIFEDHAAHIYSRRAQFMTWGRSVGTTTNAHLAQLPFSASPGDQIVIFSGGKLPFVLRTEGDNHKVVGPCYIDGIMDGEVFALEELAVSELTWFTLC